MNLRANEILIDKVITYFDFQLLEKGVTLIRIIRFSLSGQPLTILGSTGPILVFETIMFDFCKTLGWEYLPFRLWTGVWAALILIVLVATDASAFVCYITRFTEENFACLIAFIFIKKAFQKVIHIKDEFPIEPSPCLCIPANDTLRSNKNYR